MLESGDFEYSASKATYFQCGFLEFHFTVLRRIEAHGRTLGNYDARHGKFWSAPAAIYGRLRACRKIRFSAEKAPICELYIMSVENSRFSLAINPESLIVRFRR